MRRAGSAHRRSGSPRGLRRTATDISAAAVAALRPGGRDARTALRAGVADLRTLPSGGAFDAALAFDNALPHLRTDADLAAACTALRGVLAPDGLLCASIRDYDALLNAPARRAAARDRRPDRVPGLGGHSDDTYGAPVTSLDQRGDGWEVTSARRSTARAPRWTDAALVRRPASPTSPGGCRPRPASTSRS